MLVEGVVDKAPPSRDPKIGPKWLSMLLDWLSSKVGCDIKFVKQGLPL